MKRLLPHPTYANVVATLALFVALGGASYAATALPANSVGSKQLKDGAVTSDKVAPHSLTGADIKASTLGTVPSAGHAANADTAGSANSASHAASADTATSATTAASAQNAAQLGGSPPASYRDSCPSGTQLRTPELCEATTIEGHVTYTEAIGYCSGLGLRLPSPSEAFALDSSIYGVWTDVFWTDEGKDWGLTYLASTQGLHAFESNGEANVDCVATPTTR